MTLGVIDEMRSTGLAKRLLNFLMDYAESRSEVQLVALHVIDYNLRAIRFYKKNQFKLLSYLSEHYHIAGKEYDGLKLGMFVNGGVQREKWLPWIKRVLLRVDNSSEWPI